MPKNPYVVISGTSHQPMPACANEESAVPMGDGWLAVLVCRWTVGGDKNCR